MMEVLAFYKGKTSLESVLDHASGDCHSAARASFACALFFEAKGEREAEMMALPLLSAVASVDCGGDTYLRSLARIHLCHVRQGLLLRCPPLQQNKRPGGGGVSGVIHLHDIPSSSSSSLSSSASSSSSSLESLAMSPLGAGGGRWVGGRGVGGCECLFDDFSACLSVAFEAGLVSDGLGEE